MQPIDVAGDRGREPRPEPGDAVPYGGAFDLHRPPFGPEPDPRFHCETSANRHALKFIQLALKQLSPVTLLVGAPGTGKTTLVRRLVKTVIRGLQVGVMPPVVEGGEGLFERLLLAFDLAAPRDPVAARERFLSFVLDGYDAGRASLLVVDDVHRMAQEDLAALGRLTTVRPPALCPLMLLLVGPPDLRDRMETSSLRSLCRRVEVSTGIGPLSRSETAGYVRHRIAVAGGSTHLFGDDALDVVHERTRGVPRAVNALCDACLTVAAADGAARLDAAFVAAVPDPGSAPAPTPEPAAAPTPSPAPTPAPDAAPSRVARPTRGAPAPPAADRADATGPLEPLREFPGFLALVALGPDGDAPRAVGARAGEEGVPDRMGPALDLARACLGGSPAPVVASAGGAVCLLDPRRGVGVCGVEGFNLGRILRHLRGLPGTGAAPRARRASAAAFEAPWQAALWRLAEVVDRTVSPRRLVVETAHGTVVARLAGGRIEAAEGAGLAALGGRLREAALEGGRARFALEPEPGGDAPDPGITAAELLAEAGGTGRGAPGAPLLLDPAGWPLALPQGLGFDALSHAVAVGWALSASAGAQDGPPRAATLEGGALRTVAQRRRDGWIEVDRAWLVRQVADPEGGAP